jgi:hypothetical protein
MNQKRPISMIDEDLAAQLEEHECLLADGFDAALIGISYGTNPEAVYEVGMCIAVLMTIGMDNVGKHCKTVHSFFGVRRPF